MFNPFKAGKREIYIPWKPNDPLEFTTYFGQQALKRRLEIRLNAMQPGDQLKALFAAPHGYGKTAVARTLAYEMFKRDLVDYYVETVGSNFAVKADVDDLILKLKPKTFIFVDEIHAIAGGAREALYLAIHDNIYVYHRQNKLTKLPAGLSWVGATTELGKVHPSLQRRLLPMFLEPLTTDDLAHIVSSQPMPTKPDAAQLIGKLCTSPWEVKDELYATARDMAKGSKLTCINKEIVNDACGVLGIDQIGLRPQERRILETLYKHPKVLRGERAFVMAKAPLTMMSGVDPDLYAAQIEPKLLNLQMLQISSTGRELTSKALDTYFNE
jgi:Holliday junction resolvasome RuvABC ATP-dependent DNA helicase subunit